MNFTTCKLVLNVKYTYVYIYTYVYTSMYIYQLNALFDSPLGQVLHPAIPSSPSYLLYEEQNEKLCQWKCYNLKYYRY